MSEIAPFPINGGEKLRSYSLLKLMSDLGCSVKAIIGTCSDKDFAKFKLEGIDISEFDFERIRYRAKKFRKLFVCDRELISKLHDILNSIKIDIAYIDYSFYGQYISFFKKHKIPVIYGTHNAQAKLGYQRRGVLNNSRLRIYAEYMTSRFHEFIYFNRADALLVVSENDKKYHEAFVKKNKIFIVPNFLIDSEYEIEVEAKENYIVMTANFYAFQNEVGLSWFIKEVWNEQLWNKTELLLVGRGSKEVYEKLSKTNQLRNIRATGEVDNIKPYIARAKAAIVPLLHGSGSRLKCLESMALRTPLISTEIGAEGIEHNNTIIIANSAKEFNNKLLLVLNENLNITDEAYKIYLAKYSLSSTRNIFKEILDFVKKSRSDI